MFLLSELLLRLPVPPVFPQHSWEPWYENSQPYLWLLFPSFHIKPVTEATCSVFIRSWISFPSAFPLCCSCYDLHVAYLELILFWYISICGIKPIAMESYEHWLEKKALLLILWVQVAVITRLGCWRCLKKWRKKDLGAGKRDCFKHFNLGEDSEERIKWWNCRKRCCVAEVKRGPWEKCIPWSWPAAPGELRLGPALKEEQ